MPMRHVHGGFDVQVGTFKATTRSVWTWTPMTIRHAEPATSAARAVPAAPCLAENTEEIAFMKLLSDIFHNSGCNGQPHCPPVNNETRLQHLEHTS